MKFGWLMLLMSFNVFALECGDVPEGTVVRLDQGNGSLAKAAIQDQDGIGSCYANQASLMLQSAIPGNPNLSYLNLGLYFATDVNLPESRKGGNKRYTMDDRRESNILVSDDKTGIDGGHACETINSALERQKKNGFGAVCRAEDVSLEHSFFNAEGNSEDPVHDQKRAIIQASRYMNTYQKNFGYAFEKGKEFQKKREEADKFAIALKKFVNDNSDQYFVEKCAQPEPSVISKAVTDSLIRALGSKMSCFSPQQIIPTNTRDPICKNFREIGVIYRQTGGTNKIITTPTQKAGDKIINNTAKFYDDKSGFPSVLKKLEAYYRELAVGTPAQKEAFAKLMINNLSPENRNALEENYNRIALKKIDNCKAEKMLDFFREKKNFLEKAKQDSVLCNYMDILEGTTELAGILPESAFKNMSSFLDFITAKAGLDYDEAMLSLVASDCSPEKRVLIPENLKCERETMDFGKSDFARTNPSSDAIKTIQKNRKRMFSSIKENRGVGISLCTKFWSDPSYDYNSEDPATRMDTCSKSGIHSFHAITMIGYRCKNNRIQYLSQNSWGPNWKIDSREFEFEDGKIWMDEDRLFKNMSALSFISQ